MAEAEDVITDVARHATIYARELWRRHRKADARQPELTLRDMAKRLDLLVTAVFGIAYPLRVAQAPAPPSFLVKVFRRNEGPYTQSAIPATDGVSIWLPPHLPEAGGSAGEWYRILALQQAMRAHRRSPEFANALDNELQRAIFTVLEAQAADQALAELLPGIRITLQTMRATALAHRPSLKSFPPYRRPLEELVRALLSDCFDAPASQSLASPATSLERAQELTRTLTRTLSQELAGRRGGAEARLREHGRHLFRDLWTGELRHAAPQTGMVMASAASAKEDADTASSRSARLARRPEVREAAEDEDDDRPGAWMVQTSQPHEQAEDPIGMQRPTDRDDSTAADEFADALSELPEARLVSTPQKAREILLSDDAPFARARQQPAAVSEAGGKLHYPEWDCRIGAYREPGATVRLLLPAEGAQAWVDRTVEAYAGMLATVRRRFEMLRAQRVRLRKQLEGEDIDLDAWVESYADFRAGSPMAQALYQTWRPARRDMAIVLLIDVSGSTDSWVAESKRIIDVEREALLLVSIALQGLAEPYAILAFSGVGPQDVMIRPVKTFDESHGDAVARRIAALEPEQYTRAGAAIRHATAALMRQTARHRLLLLLSDGKPNDVDDYEGRYGVEDMRQAVMEAKLQGIHPFCLTIDRQAAAYLPAVFGARQYALLPRPELLPSVLLEWMKRLLAA